MHRIPYGRNGKQSSNTTKQVVFFGHALLCNSGEWVFGPPEKSLGFILADEGKEYYLIIMIMEIIFHYIHTYLRCITYTIHS